LRAIATFLLGAFLVANTPPDDNQPPTGKTYEVYFLGGQSNMEGFGFAADVPDGVEAAAAGVPIFLGKTVEDGKDGGGIGLWAPLEAGYGTGFDTDGETNRLSDRFGPELSFGAAMAQFGKSVAIIKYSRGGSGLIDGVSGYGSWDPDYAKGNGRNQYDFALAAIGEALRSGDIDGDGAIDRLVPAGIVWMQGEADAYDNLAAATNYSANLARLVALLRAALHRDDLPVVIGRIRDSGDTQETRVMTYSPEVRAAQQRFVEDDRCAALVTVSDDFRFLDDGWHYTSQDYLALGSAFAGAMQQLQDRC
jgi:hypothetical protein